MRSIPSLPHVAFLIGFFLLAPAPHSGAFEVIKNINSNKPPVEKLVIFEKGKPTDHLSFVDDANCKMSFAEDGSIVCRIINNAVIKPMIRWKGGGLPEHFPLKEYDYLILTCRMEGTNKVTNNGKTNDVRGDNLWFPVALFDDAGTLLGSASLADPTPDRRTPDKTTTLQFPKALLTFWGPGKGNVSAVGFSWGKTHDNITRDYTLVIDKIAFANDAP